MSYLDEEDFAQMRCPECKHTGYFYIRAEGWFAIYESAEGETEWLGESKPRVDRLLLESTQLEWDGVNACMCPECEHESTVEDFEAMTDEEEMLCIEAIMNRCKKDSLFRQHLATQFVRGVVNYAYFRKYYDPKKKVWKGPLLEDFETDGEEDED